MVWIKNNPVEENGFKLNPVSSSGIYVTSLKEAQCRIVAENRIKQYEVKENMKQYNSVKRAARIINRGISHDNIISAVAKLDSNDSILQAILPISSDTLNEAFIHMGGKIRNVPEIKKQMVVLEIEKRWGQDIIKEGARKIA